MYTQAFREVLAERRVPPRTKPTARLTEDSRHTSTLLSGGLVFVLAAGTFIALWESLTVGVVDPDGASIGVSMQQVAHSSLANSPVPARSMVDALRADAGVLIEEVTKLTITTAGALTHTGQAWAQSAGQDADTTTSFQPDAVPVAQVTWDQEPTAPQPIETGVQASPVPKSSLSYKSEKDSDPQYWDLTGQRLTSVTTASAPVSAPTSQGPADTSVGASGSSGSSVDADETAKAKSTRKEGHTSQSDSKDSSRSKAGKDGNSAGSSGGKAAKGEGHSHADEGHSKSDGDKGKSGKDHKGGDKGKTKN